MIGKSVAMAKKNILCRKEVSTLLSLRNQLHPISAGSQSIPMDQFWVAASHDKRKTCNESDDSPAEAIR